MAPTGSHFPGRLLHSLKIAIEKPSKTPNAVIEPFRSVSEIRSIFCLPQDRRCRCGDQFAIYAYQAFDIKKVVLVRPMAPTHNTDSEQRVIQLQFSCAGEN